MGRVRTDISSLDQKIMLVVLRQQPNAYGVSIQEKIEEDTGHEYSFGSIYAALDRLEEQGYVKSRHGEKTEARGGRKKLYFSLTAQGQAVLQGSLEAVRKLSAGLRWKDALA